MQDTAYRAIAIVGVGATLPDAPNAPTFWSNIKNGVYSISEVSPTRWDPTLYYDPDPKAPDKTYSKIGGWVKNAAWDPVRWHLPIPPKVSQSIDDSQKWAIACTVEALNDYGFPTRSLDLERTAVIFGNAMAGELHYLTAYRLTYQEYARQLRQSPSFSKLSPKDQEQILLDLHSAINKTYPEITEDTMPGELSNCIAGRVANLFNLHGPNYVCDAACASAMAAISAAIEGLVENDFDTVITGGIDRNMGINSFIKFSKIGALSATGTRPYADGADGFVMGEGAAVFILKRLADAERDGDKIYAVIRGIGGASDGKGKGITAPNPIGQQLAIKRAWANAGLPVTSVSLIEGHGTSTRVGDVVEVQSLTEAFNDSSKVGTVALGSVKSNIGHLKAAAGAAGLLKASYALHEKMLPPSLNFVKPNPNIDFAHSPFAVNTQLREWNKPESGIRRAGISAFGFGGTNFHIVLEEYIPGSLKVRTPMITGFEAQVPVSQTASTASTNSTPQLKNPLRGALVIGAENVRALTEKVKTIYKEVKSGKSFAPQPPKQADLHSAQRIAIDYSDEKDLAEKLTKAIKALDSNNPAIWKALRAQGIFRGAGEKPKVAFLYTGQGSQYVNMLKQLRETEPIVAQVLQEADQAMKPFLDKPLSEYLFVNEQDKDAVDKAEKDLRQTAITQPAVLSVDIALTKLMAAYGIKPDMVMGHSLGEYGALVTAGVLPFAEALEAVSARGREMTKVSVSDNGKMAAIFAPIEKVEELLKTIDGYVVIANINSNSQSVIGGASVAVEKAVDVFKEAGYNTALLPVSHAFHTSIVAPASEPLYNVLSRLHIQAPKLPIIANVTGDFYPASESSVPEILDVLSKQVASPVQFVKGLKTLYDVGVRLFVELGPKKALQGFVDDMFGNQADVFSLFTNHPKLGDVVSFNQALCGLYAAGFGNSLAEEVQIPVTVSKKETTEQPIRASQNTAQTTTSANLPTIMNNTTSKLDNKSYLELGQLFAEFLEKGMKIYKPEGTTIENNSIVISGAGLGLPGTEYVFDNFSLGRILRGEQFIDVIPGKFRRLILDKHITRLVKSEAGARFEAIDSVADVIKLAARAGKLDLEHQFGVPADRIPALDKYTQLAIAVGLEALRDAGIPLVLHYKTTTKGTYLPDRWGLPDELRDDTGIIFASAFPGLDSFAENLENYYEDHARHELLTKLEHLRSKVSENGNELVVREIDQQISEVKTAIENHVYTFDRRFIFRILSMGHSQFAELIGARGPNTHINSACASTTQAVALAEDWIKTGRCRRVIVVSADDVTSDNLLEWIGSGFLASGAAATDEDVATAALPFDRRRHGMILGMGAAGIVVESLDSAQERGLMPICQVLSTVTANSAFHGTRLDIKHICQVMEKLVSKAEKSFGISRSEIASQTVFVSHETYTPARGGSASAEINALRTVFGADADKIVIANTKGFTGHAMGAGVEDVVAIKALETGIVPPIANFKEEDPELGHLNLSHGGAYPINYALRLGAGFGSQISMSLIRYVPTADGKRRSPESLGYNYRVYDQAKWNNWLAQISGYASAEVEIAHRTLRIKDQGAPALTAKTPARIEAEVITASTPEPKEVKVVEEVKAPVVETPVQEVAPAQNIVKEKVLTVVAEKTGYPPDMLDIELDLEADLGIDTVKQAEVFAAIRETFDIPRQENLKLKDFPTLKRVMQFVYDHRPDLAAGSTPAATAVPAVTPAQTIQATEVAAPTEVTAPTSTEDSVKLEVLHLVSDKTGYPPDMLDTELDLEADLGVDTVKQAELFAAVREHYHIPRDENRKLKDFPTLGHVIKFVYDQRPDLKETVSTSSTPVVAKAEEVAEVKVSESVTTSAGDAIQAAVLNLVSEKTGYPQDMLDLDLDLEADLGVDTVKQAELFAAVRGLYDIPRDENRKLKDFPTLRHVIKFVYDQRPDLKETVSTSSTPVVAKAEEVAEVKVSESVTTSGEDDIQAAVLNLVSEKTGYPQDMLDLDLDLEADLGVDTVKQAELFAAVRGLYNIPRDENRKLKDFPTLRHVINFARENSPDLASKDSADKSELSTNIETSPAEVQETTVLAPVTYTIEQANQAPRRVPTPILRPALTYCKATGVMLGENSRVLIMPDVSDVSSNLVELLKEKGVTALLLDPKADQESTIATVKQYLSEGAIQGVFWLPALDYEGEIKAMSLADWHSATNLRVKLLYATMRELYEAIQDKGSFLISAVRLGGHHGYDNDGAYAPMGGAVVGFTKSFKRERKDALVKAVDFEKFAESKHIAELLVKEVEFDPGVVEVGYKNSLRWTVGLKECPIANDAKEVMPLTKDSVFVITGAAGSIVSAITADLANASKGIFYLLDLTPTPDENDTKLKRFVTDKENLKRDIFEELKLENEHPTPVMVEKELAKLERLNAALEAIKAVQVAGGQAYYHSVNLTDYEAVSKVTEEIREKHGHIDVLVHAAGIEISRRLINKEPAEFNLVFGVKSDGWFNLIHSIADMPLNATVVFSSIAGRFGNGGQTDYSAANDLLCKYTSNFRTTYPNTRAIATDWTAWGGIGMATRGSIPKMMELAGIDMLEPEVAIPTTRREITLADPATEVVVAKRLGILTDEFDETGGLDINKTLPKVNNPMIDTVTGMPLYGGLTATVKLDPTLQPFLLDHKMDGTAILPGVMGIESFVELSKLLLPDWNISVIEDVNFLNPFKFYRDEPRVATLQANFFAEEGMIVAECKLLGIRQLANQDTPQTTLHFTAKAKLSLSAIELSKIQVPHTNDLPSVKARNIYQVYFHGPAYQVLTRVCKNNDNVIGMMNSMLPANHQPESLSTLIDPRLIELCFQTAGMWEIINKATMGLPAHIDQLVLLPAKELPAEEQFMALVSPYPELSSYDAQVIDSQGNNYLVMVGYKTTAFPNRLEDEQLKLLEWI